MPQPSHRTVLLVGKETTEGTPVAPTMSVPWKELKPKDDLAIIADEGVRGSVVDNYGQSPGPRGSGLDIGGDVMSDTIGWPLVSLCPDLVVTGSSAPYTGVFSTLNTGDTQPPPQTWTLWDPVGTWQYPGIHWSEPTFKWNADGFFQYAAKGIGWGYLTGSTPTPSWTSSPKPVANWSITNKLAGAQVFVEDGELTLKRAVTAIRGANGTQDPYKLFSGDISVEGKLTALFESTTQRNIFQAGTAQAFECAYSQGAAAALNSLILHCSQAVYTEGTPDYGSDYIKMPLSFKTSANTTDVGASGGFSPIKATLQNALASGTYK